MNLIALVLLILHIFIVSCVDLGKVILLDPNITRSFDDVKSDFSPSVNGTVVTGVIYMAEPLDGCQNLRNKPELSPSGTSPFVLIVRGGCSFEHKVRNAQRSGFKAAIIQDNVDRNILLSNSNGIKIQAVFVTKATGDKLKKYTGLVETRVMLVPRLKDSLWSSLATVALILSLAIFVGVVTCLFFCRHCTSHSNTISQFHRMSRSMVKAMPSVTFTCPKEDNTTAYSCAICLEDYIVGDKLRVLPCGHKFHAACVDSWLTSWRTFCPMCKRDARTSNNEPLASESTSLLRSSIAASSVVLIDSPQSYIQQSFRSSSLQSSSLRSYGTCIGSLHSPGYSNISPLNAFDTSPYRPSSSNALPSSVQSTNHWFNSLLRRESEGSLSPFGSAHSLREC